MIEWNSLPWGDLVSNTSPKIIISSGFCSSVPPNRHWVFMYDLNESQIEFLTSEATLEEAKATAEKWAQSIDT